MYMRYLIITVFIVKVRLCFSLEDMILVSNIHTFIRHVQVDSVFPCHSYTVLFFTCFI